MIVKDYANAKTIATRESYGNALAELGKEREDLIVMDADLAGSTKTGVFRKAFPDRHINCGIAEANMMCIAAGLASCDGSRHAPDHEDVHRLEGEHKEL